MLVADEKVVVVWEKEPDPQNPPRTSREGVEATAGGIEMIAADRERRNLRDVI